MSKIIPKIRITIGKILLFTAVMLVLSVVSVKLMYDLFLSSNIEIKETEHKIPVITTDSKNRLDKRDKTTKLLIEKAQEFKKLAVPYNPRGRKEIIFIENPMCPFCRDVFRAIKLELQGNKNKLAVYVVAVPLNDEYDYVARKMICEKKLIEYEDVINGSVSNYDKTCSNYERIIALMKEVGLSVVPVMIVDGKRVYYGLDARFLGEIKD